MTKAVAVLVVLAGLVATAQAIDLSFILDAGLGETFAILGGGLIVILGMALVK
ncbi:MAG: hypothetical protein K2X93_21155 [Candidatus Obscuribacterales bacterium]|nr:hypothetical protein [Candidatus Obscuribacterales bacterium]